jgi:PPK2 family polyphosphate:nucleotide phosphotransferase
MTEFDRYRVAPGQGVRLADLDPAEVGACEGKKQAEQALAEQRDRIIDLQDRLYAEDSRSLLIVIQATDAGGKDGTVKKVFNGTNPTGVRVYGFKVPTETELEHDFLWRYHLQTPQEGMIHIFNRSHYEDVLAVRVKELEPEEVWQHRYDSINDFERMLVREGTTVLKFFLNISKQEQKERLEKRLSRPDKRWKFNVGDLEDRERWDDFQEAYQDAINRTSTEWAPWYVVPADHKWYRNYVIATVIADTLEGMNPVYPEVEGLSDIVIK